MSGYLAPAKKMHFIFLREGVCGEDEHWPGLQGSLSGRVLLDGVPRPPCSSLGPGTLFRSPRLPCPPGDQALLESQHGVFPLAAMLCFTSPRVSRGYL